MKLAAIIISSIAIAINIFTFILMVSTSKKLKNARKITWKGDRK